MFDEVVGRYRDAVDALLALSLTPGSDDDLLGLVRAVEVQNRRLAAVDHGLVAEDSRKTPAAGLNATPGRRGLSRMQGFGREATGR